MLLFIYVHIRVLFSIICIVQCPIVHILVYSVSMYGTLTCLITHKALHFALAFDKYGSLGEYLIEHGADDSIENIDGLTPYDGVAA